MKKKVLALLLTATMTAGLLSGCGSRKEESASTDPGVASQDTSSESESDVEVETPVQEEDGDYYVDEDGNKYKKFDDVKLSFLICWNGGKKTPVDQYNSDVAKAIREKIGVTVEFEGIMMSETEKLNMMFASGEMPDMVNAPYWGGAAGETAVIKKAASEGRLTDISQIVPQYPNIADAYEIGAISQKYLESDIDLPEYNGARYVLPTQVSSNLADKSNWCYGVFVRDDVAKALNVDPTTIKTKEQLYDFMVQAKEHGFKDASGRDAIVATTFAKGFSVDSFSDSMSEKKLTSYSLDENGKVTYDVLSENWVERKLFTWKLVHEGLLDLECFGHSHETAQGKVGNGSALFTCGQYYDPIRATSLTGLYETNPEMRYVPVGPMNYADGSSLVQVEPEGRSGSPVIFFPTTCSNLDAAMTWLDYVNSKEGSRLCYYGFENDTYEFNADGQPRMNAELTAKYAEDSNALAEELIKRGIGEDYIPGSTYVNKKNTAWFGETKPFAADAEDPSITAYKQMRPVEVLPGYQIDAVASGFDGYQEMAEWAFDGTRQSSYVERAYFADTEEEARKILEEYQEYLRTENSGEFLKFLDYMTEQYATRDDWAF